jgi:hypothetical protein
VSDTNFNLEERKTMKTRNQIIGMVLSKMFCILTAIITIAFITCKEDETDPKCNCPNGTEHLVGQPCCDGTDCKCVVYYGSLPNGVKIYKGEGAEVTDEQMATAVQNVIAGYNAINPDNYTVEESDQIKTNITSKVIKIKIISDKPYTWNGSVFGIRYNRSAGICQGFFEMFLYGEPPFNE